MAKSVIVRVLLLEFEYKEENTLKLVVATWDIPSGLVYTLPYNFAWDGIGIQQVHRKKAALISQ